MKVKLSIDARMGLLKFLPEQQGNMARLRMIRKFREEMSLSDAEWKGAECKEQEGGGGSFTFNRTKDPMKECEIGEVTIEAIIQRLKQLEEKGLLSESQVALYDKFIQPSGVKNGKKK